MQQFDFVVIAMGFVLKEATAMKGDMQSIDALRKLLEQCDYEPIGDYALIGDCHSAALVSRKGSIDWMCLPDFSSPSLFAALLDRRHGGRLLVSPRDSVSIARQYRDRSAVLETNFRCAQGSITITDFMPMPARTETRLLVRQIECRDGAATLDVIYQPKPDYAKSNVALTPSPAGWQLSLGDQMVILHATMPLDLIDADGIAGGTAHLQCGEKITLMLICSRHTESPTAAAEELLTQTISWWENWCSRCVYEGDYRETVMRSCMTLKLLTDEDTGAVLAAMTTSLPTSNVKKGRNWDYRFCWLRDTSLLLQSFIDMGFRDESAKFLQWLLAAGRKPRLQPLYDVHGHAASDEIELPHLEGWRGRGPVRVGNSAHSQLQLDIYGELIQTVFRYVCRGGDLNEAEKRLLVNLGDAVRRYWREPDQGIWETRARRRHYTYSKMMCWVALDRLLKLNERIPLGLPVYATLHERDAIRTAIERGGYNAKLGAYVGYFNGTEPDASLLLMGRYGYLPADDPRMQGTHRHIVNGLGRDGLLFRYPQNADYDGIDGAENLFVACNFWAVDYLARAGAVDEAVNLFERLLGFANDVGLYAEQLAVDNGAALGNFPQAFSHSGLITAAIAITYARAGKRGDAITT
ncbi:MAG TPA: glycoside hydrolase family 15 protein [Spongiibacteraceae bacterium]